MKQSQKLNNPHHQKRYGHHQKRSKHFAHVYLPYLPAVAILFLSIFVSGYRPPQRGTLAYATNLSISGLLNSTNKQRGDNGQRGLTINEKLNQAAQAKANDMTKRNYWSHNTPDGQEPWKFVKEAGYSYLKAGENLAYGFSDNDTTINGWMNSPSHRENLLDRDYEEVGFGFANSSSYNKAGQETVVVALYGDPQISTLGATQKDQAAASGSESSSKLATNATKPLDSNASKPVTRIEALTSSWRWSLYVVCFGTGAVISILLIRHGYALKRLLKNSEKFVLHHPLIDTTLLALIVLGLTLTRTVGIIK